MRQSEITRDRIEKLIHGLTTKPEITRALRRAAVGFLDDKYSDYMNLHIPTENGCVRVYSPHRGIVKVQTMHKVNFCYSGIPVFFGFGTDQ